MVTKNANGGPQIITTIKNAYFPLLTDMTDDCVCRNFPLWLRPPDCPGPYFDKLIC